MEKTEEVKEQPKEVKKAAYSAVEVPTEFGIAIQDQDGKNLSQTEVFVLILNKLDKLNKSIG